MFKIGKDREVLCKLTDSNGIEVEAVITLNLLKPISLCKTVWELTKDFKVDVIECLN